MYQHSSNREHGRVLVASRKLEPGHAGLELFRETALFLSPPRGSGGDGSGPAPPGIALPRLDPQGWTDYWWFQRQSSVTKTDIMSLYHDMACADALRLTTYLEERVTLPPSVDVEEYVRLHMVMKFNAVICQPPNESGSGSERLYGRFSETLAV